MATFNGRNWSFSDFSGDSGYDYVGNWDPFWDDVIAEMSARAAAIGAGLVALSVSSQTIGTGAKTFDVGPGKGFTPNMWVTATDMGNSANSLTGSVASYNSSTGVLVLAVPLGATTGSGTIAAWSLGIGGKPGATGPAGAAGAGPVWYGTSGGTANAQALSGALSVLTGNPSVEFVAGKTNGVVTRANLVAAPADFSAWTTFGSAVVTVNTTIAPDGSTTADTITAPAGGGVNTSITIPADAVTRVYSIHLLPGTSMAGRLQLNHGGNNAGISYDLATGTVSAWFGSVVASAINPVPTGGYRVEIATANGGGTAIVPHIFPVGGSGSGSVIAWGAQVETGAVATPYHAGTVTDGHMTLAVGSTPARPLVDAAGKALAPSAIAYGTKYVATYDGSSWRLAGGGGASVNLAATHAALFSI